MTLPGMSPEQWTVNGIEMLGRAWSLDPAKGGKGLALTPGIRDTAVSIPRRRGVLPSSTVEYDAGQLVFNLWVLGVDPVTGEVPIGYSTTRLELDRNLGTLNRLFHTPRLTVERFRLDGTVRRAVGALAQALDPEIEDTYPAYAALSVAIRIDDSFWFDAEPVVDELTVASGVVGQLWAFDGAEAPMDDLEWTIGPAWNPVVTDVGSGTWLAYDAAVLPGQSLRYDAAAGRVYGGGDLVVDQGLVRRGGRLTLSPGAPPAITVKSTTSHPVSVQVAGRRSYFTA